MLVHSRMTKYMIALIVIILMTLVPAFQQQASAHATLEKQHRKIEVVKINQKTYSWNIMSQSMQNIQI